MSPVRPLLWLALAAVLAAPVQARDAGQQAGHHGHVPHDHRAADGHDHEHGDHAGHMLDPDHGAHRGDPAATHHGQNGDHGHDHAHGNHAVQTHDADHGHRHADPAPMDHGEHAAHHQHRDHAGAHAHGDHDARAHGADNAHDPDHGLREPIPALTDADRAAAFPELHHHHQHGASRHSFWLVDQLETSDTSGGTDISWEATAWIGSDLNRLWLRTKGHALDGDVESGRLEVLYGRPVRPWWDLVAGIRQDFGHGPSRTWAAFGVQGMALYFFEIEATGYIGASGRSALNLEAEYETLFTNRLILSWEAGATAYGKSDPERLLGSGLSTVQAGLRLRYEISRQFAPYLGFEREWSHGGTADLRARAGQARHDSRWLAGVRLWF